MHFLTGICEILWMLSMFYIYILHNPIQSVECVFVTCVCGILWLLSIYIYIYTYICITFSSGCCMCISNSYVCNPVDAEYALPFHPGVAYVFLTGTCVILWMLSMHYLLIQGVACVFLTGMCGILWMLSMHYLLIQVLHVCF